MAEMTTEQVMGRIGDSIESMKALSRLMVKTFYLGNSLPEFDTEVLTYEIKGYIDFMAKNYFELSQKSPKNCKKTGKIAKSLKNDDFVVLDVD